MEMYDVERVASKGGSLRGFAQLIRGPRPISPRVADFIAREERAGLYQPETYHAYIARVNTMRDQTLAYLRDAKTKGRSIAGYGASATVTTLLYHFHLGGLVDFLVDDNPIRHGTVSPGHHIPVFDDATSRAVSPGRRDVLDTLADVSHGDRVDPRGPSAVTRRDRTSARIAAPRLLRLQPSASVVR
jgi:hypothetical protein